MYRSLCSEFVSLYLYYTQLSKIKKKFILPVATLNNLKRYMVRCVKTKNVKNYLVFRIWVKKVSGIESFFPFRLSG